MTFARIISSPKPARMQRRSTGSRVINRRPVEVLPRPELTTRRLLFRMLYPSDAGAFIAALDRSRERLRRWIPINHEHESDEHFFQRTMARARREEVEGSGWRRGAFIDRGPQRGRFVGMFGLIKIERGLEWSCEANWWVDSALHGQGYCSEAARGVIGFALREHPLGLGVHRVRAYIGADNHASLAIASKCGFTPTGVRTLLRINKALVHHDEYECVPGEVAG